MPLKDKLPNQQKKYSTDIIFVYLLFVSQIYICDFKYLLQTSPSFYPKVISIDSGVCILEAKKTVDFVF